jgi:hypothetical protein
MLFYTVFNYIYFIILGVTTGIGIIFWKRIRRAFRLLNVFVLITLVIEIAARWMLWKYSQNNAIYIFYDILNIVITAIIATSMIKSSKSKSIVMIADVLLVFFYCVEVFILKRYTIDYSIINCIINIFICFFICMFLFDKIQRPQERILYTTPDFIFSIGLLFFSSVSVLYWVVFLRFKEQDGKAISNLMYKFFLMSNLVYYSSILLVFILEVKNISKRNEREYA